MKIIIKLKLVFLFILITNLNSQAQNYLNVLNVRYYYLPDNTTNISDDNVSLKEYRFESAFPYTLKDSDIVGIKIQYKSFSLKSDNPDYKNLYLRSVKLPIFTFIKFKNPKWSTYLEISPKLNSDFENITFRHFQIGSTILFFYEKRTDFFWQFGVYYNQDTYGPFFMPLLGFNWKISDKSYCSGLLPAYLIFEQKLSKKLYTGFEMEMTGETFRLGGSTLEPNSFISQLGKNKLNFLAEPRLFLDFYLTKHLVFYIKPGFRLLQKYEHYTEDDHLVSNSEYVQGKLKNSFYAEAGIAFRFRYDEK
jgi:hypothetical protein